MKKKVTTGFCAKSTKVPETIALEITESENGLSLAFLARGIYNERLVAAVIPHTGATPLQRKLSKQLKELAGTIDLLNEEDEKR